MLSDAKEGTDAGTASSVGHTRACWVAVKWSSGPKEKEKGGGAMENNRTPQYRELSTSLVETSTALLQTQRDGSNRLARRRLFQAWQWGFLTRRERTSGF